VVQIDERWMMPSLSFVAEGGRAAPHPVSKVEIHAWLRVGLVIRPMKLLLLQQYLEGELHHHPSAR
jgi:hypothetical protein